MNSTGGTTSDTSSASTTGMKTLNQDDFLKLLATQMQAQDPMDPMKDTDFISQMANFTSLEQMKNLSSSFASFISQQKSVDAQSYLGKTVTVLDSDQGSVTGTVSGISLTGSTPMLIIGGKTYDPTMIQTIQSPATSASN
jgi:flagellar basal-body rod modification protein FlgD